MSEEQRGVGGCPRNGQPCEDITTIKEKVKGLEEWKRETDAELLGIKTDLKGALEFQGGTKAYVSEILNRINGLENKLFSFMENLVKNLTTKEQSSETQAANERKQGTKDWMDFAKWIIGGTVFVIVAYIFNGGGK